MRGATDVENQRIGMQGNESGPVAVDADLEVRIRQVQIENESPQKDAYICAPDENGAHPKGVCPRGKSCDASELTGTIQTDAAGRKNEFEARASYYVRAV
jgi:hypothetical protein